MSTSSTLITFFLLLIISYEGHVKVKFDDQQTVVKVNASDWLPYVYQEDKEFKGHSYHILRDVFKRADIPFLLRIMS